MFSQPAVVVHGQEDAAKALRPGVPVLLVSAPGAALFAGAGWWRAVVDAAIARYPATKCADLLDCADAPGRAMAALRAGCTAVVLDPACPGFAAVREAAATLGAVVLVDRPHTMELHQWLRDTGAAFR